MGGRTPQAQSPGRFAGPRARGKAPLPRPPSAPRGGGGSGRARAPRGVAAAATGGGAREERPALLAPRLALVFGGSVGGVAVEMFFIDCGDCGGFAGPACQEHAEEEARPAWGGKGGTECTASGDRATLTPCTKPGTRLRNQFRVREAEVVGNSRQCNCLLEVGSRGSPARAWQGAARQRKGRLDPSRAGPTTRGSVVVDLSTVCNLSAVVTALCSPMVLVAAEPSARRVLVHDGNSADGPMRHSRA